MAEDEETECVAWTALCDGTADCAHNGADEADDEFWPLPEEGVPPEATADFGSPEVVAV